MIGLASIGPDAAVSNIARWLEFFGADRVPEWLLGASVDRYVIVGALIAGLLYLTAIWFVPWCWRRLAARASRAKEPEKAVAAVQSDTKRESAPPRSPEPTPEPATADAPSAAEPEPPPAIPPWFPLLRPYPDAADRANLRGHLRRVSAILTQDVQATQVAIHGLLGRLEHQVGAPDALAAADQIDHALARLAGARDTINGTFIQGQDYMDEVWDVLGNRDPINATLVSVSDYLKAVRTGPTGDLIRLLHEPGQVALNANFDMGNWAAECMTQIRAKRDALDRMS